MATASATRSARAALAQRHLTITNLAADTDYYFRVAAANAGGESFPSETVGCRRSSHPLSTRVLFVNGFTRFDRNLEPPADTDGAAIQAARPRREQRHHRPRPAAFGRMPSITSCRTAKRSAPPASMGFDSCQLQAVTNGTVSLTNYGIVVWECGNQSTRRPHLQQRRPDEGDGFPRRRRPPVRLRLRDRLGPRPRLRPGAPPTATSSTTSSTPSLINNTNDDSGIYTFTPAAGSIFAGNATGTFDNGSQGIYWVGYPDALTPTGSGATAALNYPGYSGGAAAFATTVRRAGARWSISASRSRRLPAPARGTLTWRTC